jgi:hypothetical protein
MGAVQKRLYESTNDRSYLDESIASYEHGFALMNDYYNGINLAYLLNVRSTVTSGDDAIADCVLARRTRAKVASICENIDMSKLKADDQYWVAATLEEAYFGLGETARYEEAKAKAVALASARWMRETTESQISKLRNLLEIGPCATPQQARQ